METYSEGDIALILNTSKQQIRGWKRNGTIPPKAVTKDGLYKKDVIDTMIVNGFLTHASNEEPKTSPSRPALLKPATAPAMSPEFFDKPPMSREEFMRNFWKQDDRAVDVLTMSPEVGALIVNFVNKALEYGYAEFVDAWTCPRPVPSTEAKESPENFR